MGNAPKLEKKPSKAGLCHWSLDNVEGMYHTGCGHIFPHSCFPEKDLIQCPFCITKLKLRKDSKLIFVCENCGMNTLHEVVLNTTVYNDLLRIDYKGDKSDLDITYGAEEVFGDEGYVDRYECANCQEPILDKQGATIDNDSDLRDYLVNLAINKGVRHVRK